jgi:glycolate oxidase iron-sulfur subunit
MSPIQNHTDLERCVRCGICKATCPTYLIALDEGMSARGRMALLGGLKEEKLQPTENLSEKIFSCLLCEACKGICPLGIDITRMIYEGRRNLKDTFNRGRLLRRAIRLSIQRPEIAFMVLRALQRLTIINRISGYLPPVTAHPLKNGQSVFRGTRTTARVGLFLGCSVNYLYPSIGKALIEILNTLNYEVVIMKGEVCCGAPLMSLGYEDEAIRLARKNISLFQRMKAEAIISLCPTCTMVIRDRYPLLTGDGIPGIVDINEFLVKIDIHKGRCMVERRVTYHDPCHLSHGLGITEEPREIIHNIENTTLVEMEDARRCCGFGGLFSKLFKDLSMEISRRKMEDIKKTGADTVVTSCPGCIIHLNELKRQMGIDIEILHIVELLHEAITG